MEEFSCLASVLCIANNGISTVNYIVCSGDIYDYIKNMYVDNRCESNHFMNFDVIEDDKTCLDEEIK